LYTENLGKPEVPHKFRQARQKAAVPARPTRGKWIGAVAVLVILGVVAAVVLRMVGTDRRAVRSATQTEGRPSGASLPAPEKSVAVLPFDNMSRDPDNAFFTDGVQDQILTALATKVTRTMISLDRDGNTRPYIKLSMRFGQEIQRQLKVLPITG